MNFINKENSVLIFDLIQGFLGIRIGSDYFRPENLIDVAIIIFLSVFLTQPYFQVVDTLVRSSSAEGLNQWALSSFKGSFIWMIVHLILLSLFGGIAHPLVKFRKLVGGLFVGVVLIYVLIEMTTLLSDAPGLSSALQFLFGLYPLIFAFAIRAAISKEMKE